MIGTPDNLLLAGSTEGTPFGRARQAKGAVSSPVRDGSRTRCATEDVLLGVYSNLTSSIDCDQL
jgi:hypothetical protein